MLTRVPEKLQIGQIRRNLTNLLYPSLEGGWRDIFRSGWLPGWFNQQWGGAQIGHELVDAATGVLYKFETATGNIEDNNPGVIGNVASTYYGAQGFKVSENITNPSAWVKIYKVGNPTGPVVLQLYADSAGSPTGAAIAQANIAAKTVTSKADGEWYRVTFTASLNANTQYHLSVSLGGVDASNHYVWKYTSSRKYPFGYANSGTSAPVWTPSTTAARCFMVESQTTSKFMQSGGLFDQKLVFTAGSPVNQSKSLVQPLRNFFDGSLFTALVRGNSFTKGKTVVDFQYGLDHDRVVAYAHGTTGVPVLSVYTKSGSLVSISGTTDVSSGTNRDISVVVRTLGDGSDYAQIWVNGVKEAEVTGQSFSMDPLMRELGTAWVGGGFSTVPAWTTGSLSFFNTLPSTQGWTWTGTATEANAMSVANGKLYQNKSGYASTDTGYYAKSALGLSNTTGWCVEWKCRVSSSTNALSGNVGSVEIDVSDGTKLIKVFVREYFLEVYTASSDFVFQGDFKSQENVFTLCGKGNDYYLFVNGKLAVDGTGKSTQSSAGNVISFGDISATAGEHADVIWSYMKHYNGGMLLPDSNGAALNEFAYWSGNQSETLPYLYNAGSLFSVRDFLGVSRNYVAEITQKEVRRGITSGPATTSTTPLVVPEMEAYYIGNTVSSTFGMLGVGSTSLSAVTSQAVDGIANYSDTKGAQIGVSAVEFNSTIKRDTPLGLHKFESKWNTTTGTLTAYDTRRSLYLEAKS